MLESSLTKHTLTKREMIALLHECWEISDVARIKIFDLENPRMIKEVIEIKKNSSLTPSGGLCAWLNHDLAEICLYGYKVNIHTA